MTDQATPRHLAAARKTTRPRDGIGPATRSAMPIAVRARALCQLGSLAGRSFVSESSYAAVRVPPAFPVFTTPTGSTSSA